MTTPAVDAATRRAAHAWLTRFSPAIVLWDEDDSLWVTDKTRAHLVPQTYRQLLDTAGAPESGTLEVHWDQLEDEPCFTAGPEWALATVMKWRSTSTRLRLVGLDHRGGQAHFLTNDLESIRMSLDYYRFASEWGAQIWRGRGPLRPVFAESAATGVLAVIMPLRDAGPHPDDRP